MSFPFSSDIFLLFSFLILIISSFRVQADNIYINIYDYIIVNRIGMQCNALCI